jgi:hypothetical protein
MQRFVNLSVFCVKKSDKEIMKKALKKVVIGFIY